jgi:hypothetical protein
MLNYIYDYRIQDEAIEFQVLGKSVRRLAFANIQSIREVSIWEMLPDLRTLRLGNRVMGTAVEITLSKGFIKRILITPDRPREVVRVWEEYLARRDGSL